ncbi:MAG: tyrosine-type recombinase/integrase [Gammaproteobacteria bacterium]|nr:tyrosine-type recombinase/integrase [Gammaproteobacteria bacterium]MCF6363884.1 tyrosine-type recombinase/integrase [Gammaproteobacteria bacterium]
MEADIDLAKAEANPLQRQITLTDLCDAYLLKHWRGKDLGRPAMVGWWMDDLGDTRLHDFDRQKVQAALMRYKAGKARRGDGLDPVSRKPRSTAGTKSRSSAAVNRYRAVAVLKYGRGHQGLSLDPLRGIPKEPENKGAHPAPRSGRAGSPANRLRVLFRLLVLMAVGSGARLGELRGLRWVDVDFAARRAMVRDTKNGEDRLLTLPTPVVAVRVKGPALNAIHPS